MAKTAGLIRVSAISNNAEPSFFDGGTGLFRTSDTELLLSQGVFAADFDVADAIMFHGVANAYSDGDKSVGVTQAFFEYKPLSASKYRFSSRAGFFYPRLSVENTDIGWLASHFITSSAINAWVGEELRVPGIELSLLRSGRKARSPWTFRFDLGAYKGNDTTGTLIAWRGFSIHDRQTLHHERVNFAPFPSIISQQPFDAPSYTVPYTEIDQEIGFYTGVQAQYLRKLDMRYFYYDNRANPLIVDERRLYAWRTKFHSLAARYLLSAQTELSFHVMDGSTEMGAQMVYADYTAAYVAVSHSAGKHRFSARLDVFDVREDDLVPEDENDSHGTALTTNWTYTFNRKWQMSVEGIVNNNTFFNRESLGVTPQQEVFQGQIAATYRF